MSPGNLARIGQVVLDRGRWQDRQVIPAAWLDAVLQARSTIAPDYEYGYEWYLGTFVPTAVTHTRGSMAMADCD